MAVPGSARSNETLVAGSLVHACPIPVRSHLALGASVSFHLVFTSLNTAQHNTAQIHCNEWIWKMGGTAKEQTVSSFPPTHKCKCIEKVGQDLFVVHGTIRQKHLLKKNHNMVVLRHNRVLTLINAIRLTEDDERRLRKLGTVRHIIRLNPPHGAYDDEYYIDAFQAQLWSPGLSAYHPDLSPIHRVLEEDAILPIPKATLFMFRCTKSPEAAVLLTRDSGNILITSECLQCQVDNPFINMPTRTMLHLGGFMDFPIVTSPKWLKDMSPKKGSVRDDFERLLKLDFDQHIGARGTMVSRGAKERVVLAVECAFPVW